MIDEHAGNARILMLLHVMAIADLLDEVGDLFTAYARDLDVSRLGAIVDEVAERHEAMRRLRYEARIAEVAVRQ